MTIRQQRAVKTKNLRLMVNHHFGLSPVCERAPFRQGARRNGHMVGTKTSVTFSYENVCEVGMHTSTIFFF